MGALQSSDDSHECHIMAHHEITAFYDALKAAMAKRPVLPKTTPTAAEVRARLHEHDKKKHALLLPLPSYMPTTPVKITKTVKPVDTTRAVSDLELRLRELSARRDHDTNELFEAILAFKASCANDEAFLDGLAGCQRAQRLWRQHQYDSSHDLELLCKVQQKARDASGAGTLTAKLAYREPTIDGRLKKLALAASLVSSNVPPTSSQIFCNQSVTDHKLLLEKQMRWEQDLLHISVDVKSELHDSVFLDRSVMDTIYNLVALAPFFQTNLMVEAVTLAETFWVHPKQFWWTAVHACVDMDQCELLLWMLPQKPMITLRHVVKTCLEAKKIAAAEALAKQEPNATERAELLQMVRRAQGPSATSPTTAAAKPQSPAPSTQSI
ncbi:hypothetical protein SDRG_09867 [Saprolegnia diclina VS20]|uniref:Uncharacterized protein n=1 Tax=Saprolegnia diclina (strain VS20) TaxID=1156394 RepID=T0Q402_SAPDV|nr:hypothetical protein SDRG_09867 [Saprolegnia diclina VS20]EQC32544.1 hypothetical protein SDRG_09867 [Saprolegnia diclina VS20]|eukprot:XP_008614045.1 hypothetical protein SDRG_09867 [Saprolegnia diclina VS20]